MTIPTKSKSIAKEEGVVLYEVKGEVALITLNRPKEYNAINAEMSDALIATLTEASNDESVRAIILTGRGRAFCAGVDLKEASAGESVLSKGLANTENESPMLLAFEHCHKPIIGAINGFAVTGGLELAINCDFLYAAESARFADTHSIVGLVPGWGLSQKLPRIIGINRAREMNFTGTYISAETACDWGMVNKVCKEESLMDDVFAAVNLITDTVPDALHKAKDMMNTGWNNNLGEAMQMELREATGFNHSADLSGMAERLELLRKRAKSASNA